MKGYSDLYRLSQDFIHTATTYAKIVPLITLVACLLSAIEIILERYLHPSLKTVKPASVGGQAGGDKYVVHNIL